MASATTLHTAEWCHLYFSDGWINFPQTYILSCLLSTVHMNLYFLSLYFPHKPNQKSFSRKKKRKKKFVTRVIDLCFISLSPKVEDYDTTAPYKFYHWYYFPKLWCCKILILLKYLLFVLVSIVFSSPI